MRINLRAIESFRNFRNDNLVEPLRNEAYQEDENGEVAYYLIKYENNILFYFSLKCGLLYDRYIDDNRIKLVKDMLKFLWELKQDSTTSDEDIQSIDLIFEKLRSRKGFTQSDIKKIKKKNNSIDAIEQDFAHGMKRVGETFAGIELVQFCANDECRKL